MGLIFLAEFGNTAPVLLSDSITHGRPQSNFAHYCQDQKAERKHRLFSKNQAIANNISLPKAITRD